MAETPKTITVKVDYDQLAATDAVRDLLAQAWDEGASAWAAYERRCEDADAAGQFVTVERPANPYRKETP